MLRIRRRTLFSCVVVLLLFSCRSAPREQILGFSNRTDPLSCAWNGNKPDTLTDTVGTAGRRFKVGQQEFNIPRDAITSTVTITVAEHASDEVGFTVEVLGMPGDSLMFENGKVAEVVLSYAPPRCPPNTQAGNRSIVRDSAKLSTSHETAARRMRAFTSHTSDYVMAE